MKITKRLLAIFLALTLLCPVLAGCQSSPSTNPGATDSSGTSPDSSATHDDDASSSEDSLSAEIIDSLPIDGADYTELVSEFYRICYNQPETLASTMSCYPSLLRACDIATSDPIELDELISTVENGGEIQEALLFQLQALLDDPNTELVAAYWTGQARLLGMDVIDPAEPLTPANIRLIWYEQEIEDEQILGVTHVLEDGSKEFGYFYLPGGFQRLVPVIG